MKVKTRMITMNADAYMEIGSSHKICEDYALAGTFEDVGYAIVCDGCSSSQYTDVGARILAHLTKDALIYLQQRKLLYDKTFVKVDFKNILFEILIKKCLEVKDALRLNPEAFDATLLLALAVGGHTRALLGRGDGFFIVRRADGSTHTVSHTYSSNAPFYLSYDMYFERRQAYEAQFGRDPVVYEEITDPQDEEKEKAARKENLRWYQSITNINILEDQEGESPVTQLIVSTDGLSSYELEAGGTHTGEDRQFTARDIIPSVVAYKNTVGEFVIRRMRRFSEECRKDHIIHQDDVSCAAINL